MRVDGLFDFISFPSAAEKHQHQMKSIRLRVQNGLSGSQAGTWRHEQGAELPVSLYRHRRDVRCIYAYLCFFTAGLHLGKKALDCFYVFLANRAMGAEAKSGGDLL